MANPKYAITAAWLDVCDTDRDRKIIESLLNGDSRQKTALDLGVDSRTIYKVLAKIKHRVDVRGNKNLELPDFPDDDIPLSEIRAQLSRRFERRTAHRAAKQWFKIKMPDDGAFGVMVFGDPHLDNNGCNWPLLERDVKLCQQDGIYGLNIGDTLDNWPQGSRLLSLYAKSDQSVETAAKLAKWFLEDAGITWIVVLLGNHDLFPGHTNLKHLIQKKPILIEEWGAKFILQSGKTEFKVWASHDFPGHSQWNSLHSLGKASKMSAEADLYLAGHRHNWAIHQEENAQRSFVSWLVRARGYKFNDEYAERLGFADQQEGASIFVVFNPDSKSMSGRIQCFADPEIGADYLKFLRKRAA